MIARPSSRFAQLLADSSSWSPPVALKMLSEPYSKILGDFIRQSTENEASRTATATALVLSLWQLQGGQLTGQAPSLLLVQPGNPDKNPIDTVMRQLLASEGVSKTSRQAALEGRGYESVEQAERIMKVVYAQRRTIGVVPPHCVSKIMEARGLEEQFHVASALVHGPGDCRLYSKAWHPNYGLLTGPEGHAILRLNTDEDRQALAKDLRERPAKLVCPTGVGRQLEPREKQISISGALTPAQAASAADLITFGIPAFFLPDPGGALTVENMPGLAAFAQTWRSAAATPVTASRRLPPSHWVRTYRDSLYRRLPLLPYEYGFAVQQAIHQLEGVCDRLAEHACITGGNAEQTNALVLDLYCHTLRGMVLSIAGLAWFGRVFPLSPVCEPLREKAIKLLSHTRRKGPISKAACQKNLHITAAERDLLLDQLAREGLIRVEGKQIVATTYAEFVEHLYSSEEFPAVSGHRA